MFNKYNYDNSVNIDYPDTIVHKKAPTDESIRLLNEFQQKAFDNVVECVKLSNNELTDLVYWIYPDYHSFEYRARIRFSLNGKVKDFEFKLPCAYTDKSEIQKLIIAEIYKKITHDIFNGFVETNLKEIMEIYKRR